MECLGQGHKGALGVQPEGRYVFGEHNGLVYMGAREGSVYGNRSLYGSVPVKGACRAVWVSAGILSQDEEHTVGQWYGWEALMRHVVSRSVFENGGCDGVAGPHPCGSILKLAWYYWGLAGDPIAGVRGTGEVPLFHFPSSPPSRHVSAKEETKDEGAEQEGGSR